MLERIFLFTLFLAVANALAQPQFTTFAQTGSTLQLNAVPAQNNDEAPQLDAAEQTNQWAVLVSDSNSVEQSASRSGLVNLGQIANLDGYYLFESSSRDILDVSAAAAIEATLTGDDNILWFERQVKTRNYPRDLPSDPLVAQQWHLENTGGNTNGNVAGVVNSDVNVEPVWDMGYTGEGVNIAIVDDGLDWQHADFVGQYNAAGSIDINFGDLDPTPVGTGNTHGTAVGGVAAADNDGSKCGVGAAYDASTSGITLIALGNSDADEAQALNYMPTVNDIFNNSWGPSDNGQNLSGPGTLTQAALQASATNGRDGLGNIHMWAAGNGLASNDNVNYDGYANSRFTIAVGATDYQGVQSQYSEPGAPMLVNASSARDANATDGGIRTSTVRGLGNMTDTDCRNNFGGTSSATPLAAGVVALMLEANPNLTYRDVQHILVNTTEINDPTDSDWVENGAGLLVNHKYGFGRINAHAAVQAAKSWVTVADEVTGSTPVLTPNAPIPDDQATLYFWQYTTAVDIQLEHVEVVFDADHSFRGDLQIELISPDGTRSRLAETRNDSNDDYNDWVFSSVRHWGESSKGLWRVEVYDGDAGASGTWNSFQIRFYGTEPTRYVKQNSDNDDGLAAHYSFDAADVNIGYDLSGNGNNSDNSVIWNPEFRTDKPAEFDRYNSHSIYFDGVTEYATAPTDTSLEQADGLTAMAWVKVEDATLSGTDIVLAAGDIDGSQNGFRLQVESNGAVRARIRNTAGTAFLLSNSGRVAPQTWTHLALTWENDRNLILYVDGVETNRLGMGEGTFSSLADLFVGANPADTATNEWKGMIDEVRLYSRALSRGDILRVMKTGCASEGMTWQTAYTDLHCGLNESPKNVYVAEGTYQAGSDRNASFKPSADNMIVMGGFSGKATDFRNPTVYPTVLSGDIDGNDTNNTPSGHNSYHLVENSKAGFEMSGFTLEHGLADGGVGNDDRGAGVNDTGGGTYTQMIFRNNHATAAGGGDGVGGGFFTFGADVTIEQAMFLNNRAKNGGGIYNFNASTTVRGAVFSGNSAETGGAFFITRNNGTPPSLINVTANHNHATVTTGSGGAWIQLTAVNINDSIFWDNNASGTQQIAQGGTPETSVSGSIIEGGWAFTGSDNLSSDPLLIDPDGLDDTYGTLDDNVRIPRSSPAVDAGDSSCSTSKYVPTANIDGDGDGSAECDIGAFEYGGLLLIDGDDNNPNVFTQYADALDAGSYSYELFVGNRDTIEVISTTLQAYDNILYMSGHTLNTAGPSETLENDLAAWLDQGNRCFMISSEEYGNARPGSSFIRDYLGVASRSEPLYQTVQGNAAPFSGIGPITLDDSLFFFGVDYADGFTPDSTATTAFTYDSAPRGADLAAAVYKTTPAYQTAFFGFSLALVPETSDRTAIIDAFFDNCEPNVAPTAVGLERVGAHRDVSSPAVLVVVGVLIWATVASVRVIFGRNPRSTQNSG